MSTAPARPLADPAAPWWTLADIAHRAGLSERYVREKRLAEWERAGFPCPLPHCRRQLRYHPLAVLRWFERVETAARALPLDLTVIQGGRR